MIRRLAGIALVALAALYFSSNWWLTRLGSALVEDGKPTKADIAIVLAGDGTCNRVVRAGELVRDGYAPMAIVSGAMKIYDLPESDIAIRCATARGLPAEFFLPHQSDVLSTEEEASMLAGVLKSRGVKSVLAVTSNFHTARAGRLLRKETPGLAITMVAAPHPYFSPDTWWKSREGRKTAFFEWVKTLTSPLGI